MIPDFQQLNLSALTLLGILTLVGFHVGFAARWVKLPSLIGYMVLGVIVGPSVLHLVSEHDMEKLGFITQIALGFVAFSIGSELSLKSLKHLGSGIISIIFAESFTAFFAVFLLMLLFTGDLPLALIFGAMAPASAPAGTVAVIHEYKAKGSLTKALYAVVGFDDGLAIIIFGLAHAVALSVVGGTHTDGAVVHELLKALGEIGLSFLVGGVGGVVFCQVARRFQQPRDMLIILTGTILLVTGLSVRWNLSLILTNMVVGFVLVNTRREAFVHRVTTPLADVMPLLFVLFFCMAGAHLNLAMLPNLGLVGVVYIIGRSAGLIGGARIGAMLGHVEEKVKKYVGLGILSQAGVAIGLSLIVKQEFDKLAIAMDAPHIAEIGANVLTTITATCIFFEVVGPILTKVALSKAGEIPEEKPAPRA